MTSFPRVLVIDDDGGVRQLLSACVQRIGYEAVALDSGADLANRAEGDIVAAIVDLLLPPPDGFEVIRRIRELWPSAWIVAISGASPLLGAARHLGADATLSKPFSCDEIAIALQAGMK